MEIALAELSIKQSKELNILPTLPTAEETILTYFWQSGWIILTLKLNGFAVWVLLSQHILWHSKSPTFITQGNVYTPVATLVRTDRRKVSLNQDEKLHIYHSQN